MRSQNSPAPRGSETAVATEQKVGIPTQAGRAHCSAMLIHTSRPAFLLPLICGALFAPAGGHADVLLPPLLGDNMVLQQQTKATVWGRANPNEKITVKIGGAVQSATAGADGHWALKLGGLKAGGPYEMAVSGRNKIVLHNVLVGEVWVCSGQSNMAWPVAGAENARAEIGAADYPKIRLFTVPKTTSDTPESNCQGRWTVCDPSTVAGFSAVGYFFGRELHHALGTPVGLIQSSSGATPVEAWIPADGFEADPDLQPVALKQSADASMSREGYKRRYAAWVADSEKAKTGDLPAPPEPAPPKVSAKTSETSKFFNGMIAPLLPYSIRGVLWYQGESNTANPQLYRKLFPGLIRSWRAAWGEGDFPFLFVQLPNFLLKKSYPSESSWAELREAQAMALKLPKTAMAVTIDIGDEHNLHPANKQEVGRRLALAALANVYDGRVAASGPVFSSSKIEGGKILIRFKQPGGGLLAKDGDALKGFAIAGADRKFTWADAKIEGGKIVVQSDRVPKPVAVRYAWADSPDCNLYNKAGLPAAPFRTDDWPPAPIAPLQASSDAAIKPQ